MPEPTTAVWPIKSRHWSFSLMTSGWLWGLALTVGFYFALPYLPGDQATMQRYFTAHWIEYATTGLFFIGMATLIVRALTLPPERQVLQAGVLDGFSVPVSSEPKQVVDGLITHLKLAAKPHAQSLLIRRIVEVCQFVSGRRSADGLEAHLTYLADAAAARLNGSYSLIRTITWAIPILGFLGTVIGITMSIANITPEQLESSLNDVTAGLAVAFDTTALSLALSMILVFTTFVVERQEEQLLDSIEDFMIRHMVALFPATETQVAQSPLMAAEQAAAADLLAKTESLVTWQMDAWKSSLESLRSRWSETLERQQQALDQALQTGLSAALTDHAVQLATSRNEFISAFGEASHTIREQLTTTQQTMHEQHRSNLLELQNCWLEIRKDLSSASSQQTAQWAAFGEQVASEVQQWHGRLQALQESMTSQLTELRDQGATLLRLTEQEDQLIRLEDRLTQNLQTVRVVDTLDETLLSLNAAVNLLSAKTRNKAA